MPWDAPWFAWGVLPLLMVNLGYWVPVVALELAFSAKADNAGLVPRKEGRIETVKAARRRISLAEQLRCAVFVLLGPPALLNAALAALLLPLLCGDVALPSVSEAILHIVLLELIGDFGLYVGHRLQHEIPFLWKHCHSFHHQISTPTAASTAYIDATDATLQAGLPIVLATALVRPHPLVFNAYTCLRTAENVLNHSGLDDSTINILTLKFLPGRAPIAHHDHHHKFSGYGAGAKNFGENFWLWDWAFGTLSMHGVSGSGNGAAGRVVRPGWSESLHAATASASAHARALATGTWRAAALLAVPALSCVGIAAGGWTCLLLLPLFVALVVPVAEIAIGVRALPSAARGRPSEGTAHEHEHEDWLRVLGACAHFASMACALCALRDATDSLTAAGVIISSGVMASFSLNISHELTHAPEGSWQFRLGQLVHAATCRMHVPFDHQMHHDDACTPADSGYAPRGESLYHFMARHTITSFRNAYLVRRRQRGRTGALIDVVSWVVAPLGVACIAAIACGTSLSCALGLLVAHSLVATPLVVSGMYIAHYGLGAASVPPRTPRYMLAWNSHHAVSNFLLLGLPTHSIHHVFPKRPGGTHATPPLTGAPTMPLPYSCAALLAFAPSVFYRVFDPAVDKAIATLSERYSTPLLLRVDTASAPARRLSRCSPHPSSPCSPRTRRAAGGLPRGVTFTAAPPSAPALQGAVEREGSQPATSDVSAIKQAILAAKAEARRLREASALASSEPRRASAAEPVVEDGPILSPQSVTPRGAEQKEPSAQELSPQEPSLQEPSPQELSPQELAWIVAIRDAAAAESHACSCVELVELAIVTKGHVKHAIARLRKLREWERTHNLSAISFDEAFAHFNRTASATGHGNLVPIGGVGRARDGSRGFCADYSNFLPGAMSFPHALRAILGCFAACNSSLADVRRGVYIVAEAHGLGYRNVSLSTELRFASVYVGGYPVRIRRIVLVNITSIARHVLAMLLRALPAKMRDKFHLATLASLSAEHIDAGSLPSFLGGDAHERDDACANAAHWAALLARRREWEAQLAATYGHGFCKA